MSGNAGEARVTDTVKVCFVATMENGPIVTSHSREEPTQFTLGGEQPFPGLTEAVTGMKIGETKTVRLSPEKAYGRVDNSKIMRVEKRVLAPDMNAEPGMRVVLVLEGGARHSARILQVTGDTITLDVNHPLAGKVINLTVNLVDIL